MRKQIRFMRAGALILALMLLFCASGFAEGAFTALKLGDKGADVRSLQERLDSLGYYRKKIDDSFGPGMEAAVVAFNEAHGLSGSVATADMQTLAYSGAAIPFGESAEGRLIALKDIADGVYSGTLSGDSYTTGNDDGSYDISPDIAPAEMTVTLQDGQVQLYCAASAISSGAVFGVEAPRSPAYTQTVSGTLPLRQLGKTMVRAEGDLTAPGEGVWIYWDENRVFTKWEVEARDNTYHCTVSITMLDGVPTAEVVAAGSKSYRSCTIPLLSKAAGTQNATTTDGGFTNKSPFAQQPDETSRVLWTNHNASAVENDARDYYVFCELPDCTVTELETYHYLSNGKAPGQIMLFGEDGSEYGPFDAEGRDGQGGVKNAYWVAKVNIDLPAGRYAIADEDQATWSNNDGTDGWGMATVYGIRKEYVASNERDEKDGYEKIAVGKPICEFTAPLTDGTTFRMSEQRGKAVLIYLWNLSCTHAIDELSALQRLREEYDTDSLTILSLNASDGAADVRAFVETKDYTFLFTAFEEGAAYDLYDDVFAPPVVPYAVFVSPEGVVVSIKMGASGYDQLKADVKSILP